MAVAEERAMKQQADGSIPFREDYFLPEDEAGDAGTLGRDEVSSDSEADYEAGPSSQTPSGSGSKVSSRPVYNVCLFSLESSLYVEWTQNNGQSKNCQTGLLHS